VPVCMLVCVGGIRLKQESEVKMQELCVCMLVCNKGDELLPLPIGEAEGRLTHQLLVMLNGSSSPWSCGDQGELLPLRDQAR